MTWIDWIFVIFPILAVFYIGWRTQRYIHGVSDFLAGGRVAGRYLLAVASAESSLSIIGLVAAFEMCLKSGFAINQWGQFGKLVTLFITLTGFVIYRYRETRVMTMAQFFEVRYSRKYRVFAGILCYLSGVLNYAIFPSVGARFFIYYLQLPQTFDVLGLSISTFGALLALFLGMAVAILTWGGQLTCMVTDCVQGLFTYLLFTIILITILFLFTADQYRDVLLARPPGESFINPFDTHNLTDFNILFVIIGLLSGIYSRMSWQGSAGYACAAASPHEQKMGGVLAAWREGLGVLKIPLLVMAAYILLNHPDFADKAAAVKEELTSRITADSAVTAETYRRQMTVPVAIRHILPIGLTGAFASLMLMAMISTDTTYLQSWGSILIQDIILPLRRRAFTPRVQMMLIRLSIIGVAVFAWFFSYYFNQVTYITHFFSMTGALWLGGAGSVIIGGFYWKKGNAAGAWVATILGMFFGLFGFFCQTYWAHPIYPWLAAHAPGFLDGLKSTLDAWGQALPIAKWEVGPKRFPISGAEWGFLTILVCIVSYVATSLLTCREDYNLERMLHRGKYARDLKPGEKPLEMKARFHWRSLLGITHEYTRGDKILAWSVFLWTIYGMAVFFGIVAWNIFVSKWPERYWFNYFYYYGFGIAIVVGVVTTIWFTWGGTRDLIRLFRALRAAKTDVRDDGRVVGHVNADDVQLVEEVEQVRIKEASLPKLK